MYKEIEKWYYIKYLIVNILRIIHYQLSIIHSFLFNFFILNTFIKKK